MTSLFGVLNNTNNSLRLIQGQLGVVADNVAQADNPDRTKHSLQQTVDANGNAAFAQYKRQVDTALRVQLEQTLSEQSSATTLSTYMRKATDLLGTTAGTPPLTEALQKFQAAWQQLDANPQDAVLQSQIVLYGDDLSRELQRLTRGVDDIEKQLNTDITNSVNTLNESLAAIDKLNTDILATRGTGNPTLALEDRRDQLVREVASMMSIRTVERADGKLSVFTSSGLSLVDAAPAKFSYQDGVLRSSSSDLALNGHIRDGQLGGLLELAADGSKSDPPQAASTQPAAEILRKLKSQIEAVGQAFLAPTQPGEPTSFADAYNNAQPVGDGELANRFFVGTNSGNIAVNPALLSGELKVKNSAVAQVSLSLTATGRSVNADGLRLTGVSYNSMVTGMIGSWSANSKIAQEQATIATDFKSQLELRYRNSTGVNMDEEIAMLQVLQRNYSAAARVMQTVNNMLDAIEGIVR